MRLILITAMILLSSRAFGQAGTDIRAAISADAAAMIMDRSIKIGFGHRFVGKWSVQGSAAVSTMLFRRRISDEEKEHDSLLSGEKASMGSGPPPEFGLGVRYWPKGFHDGAYIGIMCTHRMDAGTDMAVGFGYAVRILEHLSAAAGYELKITDGLKKETIGTGGITISINYLF